MSKYLIFFYLHFSRFRENRNEYYYLLIEIISITLLNYNDIYLIFSHRLPKEQWWMKLRPLMRILAKHETVYVSEVVNKDEEDEEGEYQSSNITGEESSELAPPQTSSPNNVEKNN